MNSEKVKKIKKALECCKQNEIENTCEYCSKCPASDWDYETECNVELFQEALILINDLESENKSLQDLCNKTYEDLTKEIDRLDKVVKHYQELIEDGKLMSSEKLKQFAERLKEKYGKSCSEYYPLLLELTSEQLDETLKEFIDE